MLINSYLGEYAVGMSFNQTHNLDLIISKMFETLDINNPRLIKKILNKYSLLALYRESKTFSNEYRGHLPCISAKDITGNFFETTFIIFLLALYEIDSSLIDELINIEAKKEKFITVHLESSETNYIGVKAQMDKLFSYNGFDKTISEIMNMVQQNINIDGRTIHIQKNAHLIFHFLSLLMPYKKLVEHRYLYPSSSEVAEFLTPFSKIDSYKLFYGYASFIWEYNFLLFQDSSYSNIKFRDFLLIPNKLL